MIASQRDWTTNHISIDSNANISEFPLVVATLAKSKPKTLRDAKR